MKKNINLLKDENSVLNSYKIDLQNKKSQLILELKNIKKEKEKNNKPDTKKAQDLIVEKIHKPNVSFLSNYEEESESIPLADKERVITNFRRYKPINNNVDEIYIENEVVNSIPLAKKERIVTHFTRYNKDEDRNNNDYDVVEEKIIASPYYEIKTTEVSNDVINEIEKIENNEEFYNQQINNEDHLEEKKIEDEEVNDLYPISYRKLLKRFKKNKKNAIKEEEIIEEQLPNVIEQEVQYVHQEEPIVEEYYDDDISNKVLFDYTNDDFRTTVEKVKNKTIGLSKEYNEDNNN